MRNEAFAARLLSIGANICIGVFFFSNVAYGYLNQSTLGNLFDFVVIPIQTLFSFTGLISALGLLFLRISRYYLSPEQGSKWWPAFLLLLLWLVCAWFLPVNQPSQYWLLAVGVITAAIVMLTLSLAVVAVGPVFIRVISSIAVLGSIAFIAVTLGLGITNYSRADQFIKQRNLRTPNDVIATLGSNSVGRAAEDSDTGFQATERSCYAQAVVCVANVQLYEIPRIQQKLGLTQAQWDRASANNIDVYRVQHQNLYIILAQGYGKTHVTVADLSKIEESEWQNLNFSVPAPVN